MLILEESKAILVDSITSSPWSFRLIVFDNMKISRYEPVRRNSLIVKKRVKINWIFDMDFAFFFSLGSFLKRLLNNWAFVPISYFFTWAQ